jgi:hypothetical protein
MRRRKLELLVVMAIVAFAVSQVRSPRGAVTPSADFTPGLTASPAGAPEAGQAGPANAQWRALYDEAQAFLAQGDNPKAEARLVAALRLAPLAGPEALHETLDDLGLVCFRLGEYQRCQDYQQRAIAAASELAEPGRAATLGLYETRLATVLGAMEKREDALSALARAQGHYLEAYPAGSPAYSEAMNSLAAQHRSLGDNEGAARIVEDL